MSLYKKKILVKLILATLLFVVSLVCLGFVQMEISKRNSFYESYLQKLYNSKQDLTNSVCVNISPYYKKERYVNMEKELAQIPGFKSMGVLGEFSKIAPYMFYGDLDYTPKFSEHKYLDGDTIQSSFSMDISDMKEGTLHFSESITYENEAVSYRSYILNSLMRDTGLVELIEGEYFYDSELKEGEDIPIIVSEGFPFKLGDKLRITLPEGFTHTPDSPPDTVTAYVKGICKNNKWIPGDIYGTTDFFDFEFQKEHETVFLPDITKIYFKQDELDIPPTAYDTFSVCVVFDESIDRDKVIPVVEKYGVVNEPNGEIFKLDTTSIEYFGKYELPEYKTMSYAIYGIAAAICALFIPMIVLLLKQWRKDD